MVFEGPTRIIFASLVYTPSAKRAVYSIITLYQLRKTGLYMTAANYLSPVIPISRSVRPKNIVCLVHYCHFWLDFSPTPALPTMSSYTCSVTPGTTKASSSNSPMGSPGICCWFPERWKWGHWGFEATVLPNICIDHCGTIAIYQSII